MGLKGFETLGVWGFGLWKMPVGRGRHKKKQEL